tara:strand:+ start:936 stop:1286 length:351 start_codon:yes stop_codon:yes gene_type:complete
VKELLYEDNSEFKEGYVYREYRSDKPLDHNQNINVPEELELLVGKTITKAEYLISDFRSVTDPDFLEEETGEETDFVMLTLTDEVGQEFKIYISRDPEMNSSGYIRGDLELAKDER